jgi:type IV pilus assembly protein PilM
MKTPKIANFYHDKPVFGFDIGHGSIKVMQIAEPPTSNTPKGFKPRVIGYGFTVFDKAAQDNGVIVQPEIIAAAAHELFNKGLIGDITTRRVAMAIPAYRTFTRNLQLPKLRTAKELHEAVELEAEQYISVPLEDLYLDYQVVRETNDQTELFVTAVPKAIVDSYVELSQVIGLEPILVEPTVGSSGRLFSIADNSDEPAFIIDFGSLSCDISIYDGETLVAGTVVQGGGANFTNAIKTKLGVSLEEAGLIKTRYGLGVSKRQKEIKDALEPTLNLIVKEIRRMVRYHEERYGAKRPVKQIITLGGGANMPGLSEYLTEAMRMAVRHVDPWQYFNYKGLQPPTVADRPMYAMAAGLSLTDPKEVFKS